MMGNPSCSYATKMETFQKIQQNKAGKKISTNHPDAYKTTYRNQKLGCSSWTQYGGPQKSGEARQGQKLACRTYFLWKKMNEYNSKMPGKVSAPTCRKNKPGKTDRLLSQ